MKIRKLILPIISVLCISCMCPTDILATVHNESKAITSDTITRIDFIDWQYKTINGVPYRRLYNYSTGTPLSDWEIVP